MFECFFVLSHFECLCLFLIIYTSNNHGGIPSGGSRQHIQLTMREYWLCKYTLKRGIVCPCVLIIVLAKSVQTKRKLFPFEPKMEHLIVRGGEGGGIADQAGRSSFKHTAVTPALCHCRPNGSMFLRSMTRQLILSFKI
jgi:hypothetical protein